MKWLIRLEELGLFLFSVYLFTHLSVAWWLFPVLLLVPDVGMLGYIGGTRAGAVIYNLFHFRALALCLYVVGVAGDVPAVALVGVILFAHASLDRAFGYGLKYGDQFGHTHLGAIGEAEEPQ